MDNLFNMLKLISSNKRSATILLTVVVIIGHHVLDRMGISPVTLQDNSTDHAHAPVPFCGTVTTTTPTPAGPVTTEVHFGPSSAHSSWDVLDNENGDNADHNPCTHHHHRSRTKHLNLTADD